MTWIRHVALVLLITVPLVACSARPATTIYQRNPYACKDFQEWFRHTGGNAASGRSGARSILVAAVTMAYQGKTVAQGKLYRDLFKVRSLVARTEAAESTPMLPADRRLTMTAIRLVQRDCRHN